VFQLSQCKTNIGNARRPSSKAEAIILAAAEMTEAEFERVGFGFFSLNISTDQRHNNTGNKHKITSGFRSPS
jgi:hypothetical protein